MCDTFTKTNLDPCGLSEYFRVPRYNVERGAVLKIPDTLDFETATLIEPIGCCIRGLNKVPFEKGDDILVIGAGSIGLIMISLLKIFGAGRIISSEITDHRLKAAGRIGAHILVNPIQQNLCDKVYDVTDGRGVDLSVVAVGGGQLVEIAAECTRKGGKVLMFGAPPKGDVFTYDASKLFIKELSIIPSYSTTEIETTAALKLLTTEQISIHNIFTHKFEIIQAEEALKRASKAEAIKVIINFK
jgi:L-iditol 2-dehydrogenase